MKKMPVKQIYLLSIAIIGLIALSVYSTYALFTFESSTSDVVSIHTPKSLKISTNAYEYQKLEVEANKITTTDIDIYNDQDYEICYSIWYQTEETNKVQIVEINSEILTATGTLAKNDKRRVTLAIINDSDNSVKINIGTIGAKKENNTCSLNLASDKQQITVSYKALTELSEELIKNSKEIKTEFEGYLTYEDITEKITYNNDATLTVANEFTYTKELFTLTNKEELTLKDIENKINNENKTFYFCNNNDKCNILYKIETLAKEELVEENKNIIKEEDKKYHYHITKYDKLIGYQEGDNGLRKVGEDYYFYGDNPNNYIYYNCEDNNLKNCELWRIIGLNYNQETKKYNLKIVRNSSIGKYKLHNNHKENLLWSQTTLYEYLNKDYQLNDYQKGIIEELNIKNETILDLSNKIKYYDNNQKSSISLLSLTDYQKTSSCHNFNLSENIENCLTNNWLNNQEINSEWTKTIKETIAETIKLEETIENSEETNEETTQEPVTTPVEATKPIVNYGYSVGTNIKENDINTELDVRPVVYLKSRLLVVDGDGSFASPYVIK